MWEPTEWLSEPWFPSPIFFNLLRRLSVSRNPYLLLITGTSAGSPALDLNAPVPRLHIQNTKKTRQPSETQRGISCLSLVRLSGVCTLPFACVAFTKLIVFPEETVSVVAGDFFPGFNVPQHLHTRRISSCRHKLHTHTQQTRLLARLAL